MRTLFLVPTKRVAIKMVGEYEGRVFITIGSPDFVAKFWDTEDFLLKNPQLRSKSEPPLIKTACAYNDKELKILARKVLAAMQEDEDLTVNEVVHEQMDLLDEEIKAEQAEIDAIDDQELYAFAAAQHNR